ncbi:MAG: hypothetical protein NVS2B3_08730 [Vulcanimicrobiaceae bacterium]
MNASSEGATETGDLEYVGARIPHYVSYQDERTRHDSDLRVRAYVGTRLTDARARLASELDEPALKALDDVLMRCMFSDQVFVRKFEHARLEAPMIAALVRSDRTLIELAEAVAGTSPQALRDLTIEIDKEFEYRRSPEPL